MLRQLVVARHYQAVLHHYRSKLYIRSRYARKCRHSLRRSHDLVPNQGNILQIFFLIKPYSTHICFIGCGRLYCGLCTKPDETHVPGTDAKLLEGAVVYRPSFHSHRKCFKKSPCSFLLTHICVVCRSGSQSSRSSMSRCRSSVRCTFPEMCSRHRSWPSFTIVSIYGLVASATSPFTENHT
jgi:hypothetical protein